MSGAQLRQRPLVSAHRDDGVVSDASGRGRRPPPPTVAAQRLTVTGWVVVHLVPALAVLALLVGSRAALALAATLAVAALTSWFHARGALRGLRARWLPPPQVHAGQDVVIGASFDGVPVRGPVSLVVQRGDGQPAALAGLASIDHLGLRLAWTTRFPRRGPSRLPPLLAATSRPFGLLELRRVVSIPASVLVLPAIGHLRRHAPQRLTRLLAQGRRLRRGHCDEPHQLRDWRPGDGRSRVHWRASARRGSLLVMEREDADDPQLCLYVDLRCRSLRSRRFERLLAAAATLTHHADERGWQTRLHAPGLAGAGVCGQRAILEALAVLSPRTSAVAAMDEAPAGALVLTLAPETWDEQRWVVCGSERLAVLMTLPRVWA
jgi:uncharacterized protein (DUF58 family)